MNLIIKASNCSPVRMNGEYGLDQSATIEEHLDRWENQMKEASVTGNLRVGYFTFREQDSEDGQFHEILRREVK